MATPTASRSVSTPKTHLPNTPNRMLASPRPGTGSLATKTLAHKSPATAMKTPASSHGHLHGLSVSSHPSSTPLATAAIHDELLNLNSPAAALINSIAQQTMTPLPSGHDGLNIGTQSSIAGKDVTRSPEAERRHRLQQAADILKSKIMGRGVTRDGIERAARLHGLEALWDDNNLVIAGNVVEIEITFDPLNKSNVQDLSLKFNYDDEQHVQAEGTAILKAQSGVGTSESSGGGGLGGFASNIQYLAQLDRIDVKPNCFQLTSNLSQTFQDIWKEEKQRLKWRNDLHHLRHGAMGRPSLDQSPDLGLKLTYWARQSDDAETPKNTWKATMGCEAGPPTINRSKHWLKPRILTEDQPGQNVLDANDHTLRPDWQQAASGLAIKTDPAKDEGGMDVDTDQSDLPQPLEVHFICDLEPEILLPLTALSKVNGEINMVDLDAQRAITYHRVLQRDRNLALGRPAESEVEARWTRRLPCIGSSGALSYAHQSYKLYSTSQDTELWYYPVSRVRFNHPRQLAELLPLLRMHTVVWTLLHKLASNLPQSELLTDRKDGDKGRVVKRSNTKSRAQTSSNDESMNVDLVLDVVSNASKVKLEVVAPFHSGPLGKVRQTMLNLSLEVTLNGQIQVTAVSGVPESKMPGLLVKLGKMLTSTEDLGMVLHWLCSQDAPAKA